MCADIHTVAKRQNTVVAAARVISDAARARTNLPIISAVKQAATYVLISFTSVVPAAGIGEKKRPAFGIY